MVVENIKNEIKKVSIMKLRLEFKSSNSSVAKDRLFSLVSLGSNDVLIIKIPYLSHIFIVL